MDGGGTVAADRQYSSTLRLSDGRRVGYAEYGDPEGSPVVYFPGLGDSRLSVPPVATRPIAGARVIAIDAPGVGLSDPAAFRSVADRAEDVPQLADLLRLERFAVLGWSAGGPHALAAAWRLPDRVRAVGIACGFAPLERAEVRAIATHQIRQGASMMSRMPFMASLLTRSLPKQYRKHPRAAFEKQFGSAASASDRRLLDDASMEDAVMRGAVEAVRQGSAGQALEMRLLLAYRWRFQPEDITVPTYLWYGGDDRLVTPATGEYLRTAIPNSVLKIYPGEGHLLPFAHWSDILATLVTD
jgi:pimeloyl-ACP methyl ester carboxylesterase